MLKISDITIEKIKNNRLERELPELYDLKNIIEKSLWHNNDSTFSHTLKVLKELEKILKKNGKKTGSYLDKRIDNYKRKELLFLAALLHDIAKKETIVKEREETYCPEHEEVGSLKVKKILERFDLSPKEKEIVIGIVKNHGILHKMLDPNDSELDGKFVEFKKNHKDIFIELVLFSMSDTLGCELKDNATENFKFRINFYQDAINGYK
jgi:UTP:GlnB (protein PII) uridylyltransferase